MLKRRILSSSYLGAGLAIATGVMFNLGSVLPARAQADLNLQSRLETIMPPVGPQLPAGKGVQPEIPTSGTTLDKLRFLSNAGCDLPAPLKKLLEKGQSLTAEDQKQAEIDLKSIIPNLDCTIRQPQTVQISFPLNPSYETNVLRARSNNSSPGGSAGFGGQVQVTTGVEHRPWDLFILNAQEASARYSPNPSPSTDGLSQQASYQMFLYAYGYDPNSKTIVNNLVPGSPRPALPGGTTTFDTLTFSVLNQTGFMPTFKSEKSDFLTPQVSLAFQNIGLDELSAKPCITPNTKFCYYANVSFTAGQTFSDVIPLENVNFAASVTLAWNINSDWSLTLPATATAKDYEHVVGGRRDLQLQVGPVLTYSSPNKLPLNCQIKDDPKKSDPCYDHQENIAYTFKLPISYYKNYSTLSTAAWSGWVILPTLSISFNWSELKPKS
jgi:hypothetical protein